MTYARYVAPCFDSVADYLSDYLSVQFARLPGRPTILDIGCGDGRLAARLADSCQVVAADRSWPLLTIAAARPGTVTWLRCDAHRLPLRDASMDAVICSMSLPFFSLPRMALSEMARVAKPIGTIIVASGPGAALPGERIVELTRQVRITAPDALIGFLAGQVPTPGGAPVPSIAEAADLIARSGGEVCLNVATTLMHLNPAAVGGIV